jgi:TolA-binding protein
MSRVESVELTPAPREAVPPETKLYSPIAIGACTFLFSPLVGGLMAAVNHRRLGEEKEAKQTAMIAVGATATLMVIGAIWPDDWGNAINGGIAGASGVLAVQWAQSTRNRYEEHTKNGGVTASPWPVVGGGVIFLALLVGLVFYPLLFGNVRTFDEGVTAFNDGSYTTAEARFRAVLDEEPEHHEARYNLGLTLAREGRVDEARQVLGRIPDGAPIAQDARRLRQRLAAGLPP